MPTSLTFDEHLDALRSAGERLILSASDAGFEAAVPTCPSWDAAALVAHQAMVHRWATAHVDGSDPEAVPHQGWIRENVDDLAAYYRSGHAALLGALRNAPVDLEAMRFLNDAPPARAFWARRQAHETTIHMVDALAAVRGSVPSAGDTGIAPGLAADGIDELLNGFFTRGKLKLYDGSSYTIVVEAADVDRRWTLRIGERLGVEPDGAVDTADAAITGTASGVYLALWNRGSDVTLTGRSDVLERWRQTQRVRWS